MRAASGFEPRTKHLETRALVGSATREALGNVVKPKIWRGLAAPLPAPPDLLALYEVP